MSKVAIYSRKSKFTEKGESIENQVNMCIQYAKNIGLEDYEIYEDEGFSGGNINRPKFQKLMKDLSTKKFTHLICYRLDRISRNVADFAGTIEILNKHNVAFISIKEQFDTSSAMGRAMMNVSATFAQLERETIAERIKDNLQELSKTGRWLGGPAPLGYKSIEVENNNNNNGKSKKKHILQVDENESHILKMVYELFLKHKSFQKVSTILENQGIYSRKGSVFSRNLVKQTIDNPVYCVADKEILDYFKKQGADVYGYNNMNNINGLMPYNRRTYKGGFSSINNWIVSIGEHPGLIDSETWIRCQSISKEIKEITSSNRKGTSQQALLSGLVVCGICGSAMAPRQNISNKYNYRYYSCNLRNTSAERCTNNALNAYDAEEFVINTLKSLTKEDMIKNYENLHNKTHIKLNNKKLISDYLKDIENNKKLISNLVIKISYLGNDPILLEPFKLEIKKLTEKNKALEAALGKLNSTNEKISSTYESLDKTLALLDNLKQFFDFTEDFELKKRLIRSLVKYVIWNSKTGILDIIFFGSDEERPKQINLPLSDSIRRNGPC